MCGECRNGTAQWYALQSRLNGNRPVPRDPQDMPCGGLVGYHTVYNHVNKNLKAPKETLTRIANLHVITQHFEHVELPSYLTNNNLFERNARVRLDYLDNKLDDPGAMKVKRFTVLLFYCFLVSLLHPMHPMLSLVNTLDLHALADER